MMLNLLFISCMELRDYIFQKPLKFLFSYDMKFVVYYQGRCEELLGSHHIISNEKVIFGLHENYSSR